MEKFLFHFIILLHFFISSINHGKYFHNKIIMPFLCVFVLVEGVRIGGEGKMGRGLSCFDNFIKYNIWNSYKSVYRMEMCDFRFKINIR